MGRHKTGGDGFWGKIKEKIGSKYNRMFTVVNSGWGDYEYVFISLSFLYLVLFSQIKKKWREKVSLNGSDVGVRERRDLGFWLNKVGQLAGGSTHGDSGHPFLGGGGGAATGGSSCWSSKSEWYTGLSSWKLSGSGEPWPCVTLKSDVNEHVIPKSFGPV